MNHLLRRLRGAVGIGLTWSVLWMLVGLIGVVVIRTFQPEDIGPGENSVLRLFAITGTIGFLSGIGFAALLSLTERRRKFGELSLLRVAVWGGVGAGIIPFVIGINPDMGLLTGSLGAAFAIGSLAIARRASRDQLKITDNDATLLGTP